MDIAMSQTDQDRALAMIGEAQERLAIFASESCAAKGRGVVRVSAPELPPGITMVSPEMAYHTLDEIRGLTGDAKGSLREQADVLIGMIETYDPEQQAVIMVAFGAGNPISVKMRLERPFILDDAGGVH